MVVLHVKRDQKSLFLFETKLTLTTEEVLDKLVTLHNGILKVQRICDEVESLSEHGVSMPPEMRGLLEQQIKELNLRDDEGDQCQPTGGSTYNRDELQRRTGKAPTHEMKQVLLKTKIEANKMVGPDNVKSGNPLEWANIKEALSILKGSVSIVYPMGLPSYDPIRMELENVEELDQDSYQFRQVVDPAEATLWFANKEMKREEALSKYLGKNEKTKVIVKLSTRRSGQPASESWLNEDTEKQLAAANFKRMEQLRKLERDDDDSYLNSPWADGSALKKKFHGLDNVSWKPT